MKIIQANKAQLQIIQELAYSIWPIAYSKILSKEQLCYMMEKFYSLEALIEQMDKRKQVFLLIQEEDEFVGFASYEINIEKRKTKIHKLYVLPKTQGKGFGVELMNEIEKRAIKANDKIVFLNVNRFNKAQHFYTKLGFEIAFEEDIEIGNGYLMEDFVMEKIIKQH